MIFLLDHRLVFPDPLNAEEDGLLAVGGDLSVERLKLAYSMGIFPWFSEEDPILWYCPKERCVLFPDQIKISKSLQQAIRNKGYVVTWNRAFERVIQNCSKIARAAQQGTWITVEMQEAYINLHKKGMAQSIEVWDNQELIGGLYGVSAGNVFCGESMFSIKSDASKIAMVHLCQSQKYQIIDCQLPNNHLINLGAEMISLEKFRKYLDKSK